MRFPAALGLVAVLGGCVDPAQEARREELICTASEDRLAEAGRVGVILGEYDCNGKGADLPICRAASDLHDALTQAQYDSPEKTDLSLPKSPLARALEARCGSTKTDPIATR